MRKTWLEIYGLAVCFFAVACFVIVLGIAVWHVVALTAPEFALDNYNWERHQSDAAFRESLMTEHQYGIEKNTYAPPEGVALTQERERSYAQAIRARARSALQDLVQNLIVLLIAVVVFVVHWKIAARARQSAG
jgi:hypothetical protein